MKPILLVYKTKTGFTKKYVDWIAEEISCQTVLLDHLFTRNCSREFTTVAVGVL